MRERPDHWTTPTRLALDQLAARWLIRLSFAIASLVLAAAIVQEATGAGDVVSRWRFVTASLLGSASLGAVLLLRAGRPRVANALVLVAVILVAAVQAWATGIGLRSLLVAGSVFPVVLAGLLVGPVLALAIALLDGGVVIGLHVAELRGWIGGTDPGSASRLFGQLLLVIAGAGIAQALAQLFAASVGRALAGERRLDELLQLSADWVWEMDPKGRLTYISPSFEGRTGRSVAEFLRTAQPGGPQIADDEGYRALVDDMRARRAYSEREITYHCADGTLLIVRGSGKPIFDAAGALAGWWGASRNVTAERLAERALQRTQAMVDRLVQLSPDAIIVTRRRDGRLLLANPAFLQLSGFEQSQALGRNAFELGLWRDPAEGMRLREALDRDPIVRNLRSEVWARGERRAVLLTAAAFDADGEEVVMITVRDVTEIERAKQVAEDASQAKSVFLATMSHEIRTPLNGVLGLARLLQDSGLDAAKQREYLVHLIDAAELLTGIVSDVLDLSKIEAGQLQIENIAFDLPGVVNGTFRTFAPIGRERGLVMRCTVDPGVPERARGDPVRLRQILANYLSNALKFTTRGEIELGVQPAGAGRVRFEVRDTGIGVGAEARALLFRPFAQADSSTTRRFGGTGLGLSICRELAERMGGSVGVVSDGTSGSCFWAELALAPEDGAAGAGTAPARPLQGLTVLVAEDNPVNMLVVGALLERLGADVIEATDGAEAVEIAVAESGRVDAVLMDLHMPRQDGLEATRRLRADARTAALPVFAISAATLENERRDAAAAGMNGFIVKPVVEGDLVRALGPLAPALS